MKYNITLLILFIIMMFYSSVVAQHYKIHPDLKIDTSYTVFSAYKKYKDKYPFISIATYKPMTRLKIQRDIVYHSFDHRDMHLDLFQPAGKTRNNKPCIVLIHGGGWISGDKSELENYALALADNGYITISVEYRLSNEALYPTAIIDIKTAIKWITAKAHKCHIDTTRVTIMGASAGGQLAALIGATCQIDILKNQQADAGPNIKINSIIDLDGVLAFIHPLSEEGLKQGGAAEKWFGVHFKVDSTKWIEASALTYAGPQTPTMLFIASSFPRFQAGREDMIVIMNKYNIYSETHIFNDAPHSFWLFNPWFKPTLEYVLNFLKRVNTE